MTANAAYAESNGSAAVDPRIAIVGIGCHFPGEATSPEKFWDLLASGRDATREVPEDRWESKKFYDSDRTKIGKMGVTRGGFLDRVDQFDAQFFGISPREAIWIDPQQRLLMRVAYESIEDAGLDLDILAGTDVGVFIGGFTLDYQLLQNYGVQSRYELQAHSATGMMMTMLSNRLSHAFNFTGPSMSIDTACSSSLVAVHLAAQSILRGECPVAIAGGVNVMLAPNMTIAESKGGFLSPDGRCKAFDARADGYARGEGAGVVLLKPLAQAQADQDPIYAVIMGTGVSQDGRTDGITVPNGEAQQRAIRAAHSAAGVPSALVQYVEAHGTGTPVGDPIEATAIGTVLSEERDQDQPIMLGSVKTNIGHLEAAAGVAGLIKTSLALHHKKIPAHLHFENPNPQVPLDDFNLRIPGKMIEWPSPRDGQRLAGVNSFGFGGTNAHVVVGEAPARTTPLSSPARSPLGSPTRPALFPISARTPEALADLAALMAGRVTGASAQVLADVSHTAALRRTHHDHRAVVVARNADEAVERFRSLAKNHGAEGVVTGTASVVHPKVAFVCTGMGPQWWGMGRRLYHNEPIFRAVIERCSNELAKYTSRSLLDEFLADEDESRMSETEVAQPANFAVQVGLAELWKKHGIEPDAVIGHSTGELAAQYLSGVLSFEDAVRVAYHRSNLQQRATGTGRMLAVGLSPETLDKAVSETGPGISVAAINSQSMVTMSGDATALENMAAQLETFGVFHKFLQVKVPYHSPLMDPLRDDLIKAIGHLPSRPATVPLYSTVTGTRIGGGSISAQYWWQNVRATVLFGAAFSEMLEDGYTHFVELGPHTVLANSMREVMEEHDVHDGVIVPSMRRDADDEVTFYSALAALHCGGRSIPWEGLCRPDSTTVDLPRYPWQLTSYWNESVEAAEDRHYAPVHPLLGQRINAPHPTWEVEVGGAWLPHIDDHQIHQNTVVPGSALVEMFHAAAADTYPADDYSVCDLQLLRAIVLDSTNDPRLRTTLHEDDATVEIASFRALPGGDRVWTVHATARIIRTTTSSTPITMADDESPSRRHITGPEFYATLHEEGFQYGPAFRTITDISTEADMITAEITLPEELASELDHYHLHPVVLDAALQTLLVRTVDTEGDAPGHLYLPTGIEAVRLYRRPTLQIQAVARITRASEGEITCNVTLWDRQRNHLADIVGYTAQAVDMATDGSTEMVNQSTYQVEWESVASSAQQRATAQDWDGSTVAIFADRSGVGDALADQLTEAGKSVIKITPAPVDDLKAHDPSSFELDPADSSQYRKLAQLLHERGADHLIHLWATDAEDRFDTPGVEMLAQQQLASVSVFQIVRAMLAHDSARTSNWRLWLVTRLGQSVCPGETPSPTQAALWGCGRVLGHQEIPQHWGGLIDIDGDGALSNVRDILRATVNPTDDHNAFRNGTRHVARLTRVRHDGVPFPVALDPGADYLVTGGLGALGLVVARYLAEHGARHILLISRSVPPDREEWASLPPDHPHAAALHSVRTLERETGCQVEIAAVDVTDEARLRDWRLHRSGGRPIRGVVHAAGVVDDALVQRMTPARFDRVLQPKIQGAWNLHRNFNSADLEFFTMFSSTGAVIASPGQINYASGNAFMDGLAALRRSQGLPAVSLGWGPWSVGMVKNLNLEELYARLGIGLITPRMGAAVMSRYLMGRDRPHAIVISADWRKARDAAPSGVLPPLYQRLVEDSDSRPATSILAHLLTLPERERPDLIAASLQEIVAGVLALDPESVTTSDSLTAFGMDSMMALEVRNRVQGMLEIDVPVLDLLHGTTIGQLALTLTGQLGSSTSTEGADALVSDQPSVAEPDDDLVTEELERLLAGAAEEEIAQLIAEVESPAGPPSVYGRVVSEERS